MNLKCILSLLIWFWFASFSYCGNGKDIFDGKGSSCDTVFTSDKNKSGIIISPNYPNPYPPKSHCKYDFQGRPQEKVQIVFSDFDLYYPPEQIKGCDGVDSTTAYVYIKEKLEIIDSFCGKTVPKSLMSSGPQLSLVFNGMYSSRDARGIKATYFFTENFGIKTGRQSSDFPCSFVFNSSVAENGTFTSPNFPGLYPRNTECRYFFHGEPGERVHIRFTYFDVEGVPPCEAFTASDYVEFSNFMTTDRKYSRYCGPQKDLYVESDRNFFRVIFRSNDRLDGMGFNATYNFLDEIDFYPPKSDYRSCSPSLPQQVQHLIVAFCLTVTSAAVVSLW